MLKLLVELAGVAAVVVGVGLVSVPAAFVIAGVTAVVACEVRS